MIKIEQKRSLHRHIPDGEQGLLDQMHFSDPGGIIAIAIELEITHPFKGDLYVEIIAPFGESVVLHDRQGGSENDLKKTYYSDIFKSFLGKSAAGIWSLKVMDSAPKDSGVLEAWKISLEIQDT